MINQSIHINGLVNHLLCAMHYCLNDVHINEVPKFLAESPSETTESPSETACAIELVNPFDATHSLIIMLQLNGVTSYFDLYSLSVAEYENEDIPKIHLTVEEPPLDLLTD